MPPVGKPLFLTPEELAGALRVSPETVRRWLRTGEVAGQRVGRLWRVPWEEGVRLLGNEEKLLEALKGVRR
ncbi:MAG: helix-turn-helix domain-containing protein [Thermus sp.]|uniref:helix-turn-helix domain-containing protein n=1 Tax=Thermus sp. TaxID=275 RepID=UPI00391A132A